MTNLSLRTSCRCIARPRYAPLLLVALLALLAFGARAAQAAAAVTVALTADTEGHVGPCQTCPAHPGLGGLDRRATVLAGLRAADPHLLLLDAGNLLHGPESITSGGRVMTAAYAALKYDAVNVSYRDFRTGKAAAEAALSAAGVVPVSANLLDAESGKLLFKPYVTRQIGGATVAVLGVTDVPATFDALPHLKRQLAGITVQPPAEALTAWLPKARAEAGDGGAVLLLYYGSPAGAEAIRQQFGKELAGIFVGGARPEHLPAGTTPPVVGVDEHGKFIAVATVGGAAAEVKPVRVEPSVKPDAEMRRLLDGFAEAPDAAVRVTAGEPAQPPLPAPPAVGQAARVARIVSNRGVRLTVATATALPEYGPVRAAAGRSLLVLDTQWENTFPLTLIKDQQVPTEYQIPNLADHVYLVINGIEVARVAASAHGAPGHVPVKEFRLERIGSRISGNLVFDAPAAERIDSVELRYYDFVHGHMALPLLARPGAATVAAPKPLGKLEKNEVVEAGIFDLKRVAALGGKPAPAGMTYVVADLRARSMFTFEGDATAFDPKARPGSKMAIGTVADWTEAHKYLQLVVDGEYGYAVLPELTTLPTEPRFLPDLMTGGQVVFVAPAEAKSLEIRCDFPNAKTPEGKVIRPKGLTLAVEGTRPQPPKRDAIVSIDDDVFKVAVVGQAAAPEFAGAKAIDGKKFVVLDVSVNNTGKDGEFFQTREQLKYVTAAAEQLAVDAATWQGVHRPAELVWIPAGERRTFQVAYQVPASESAPRLGYVGVSKAEVLALKPLEGDDAAAAPAPVAEKPAAPAPAMAEKPAAPGAAKPDATKVAAATPKPDAPKVEPAKPAPPPKPAAKPAKKPDPKKKDEMPRVTAKQPHKPKGLAGVGLTAEQVNEAIDRGARGLWAWIVEHDIRSNYEFGYNKEHYLAALALVHADAHKKIPEFDAALRKFLADHNARKVGSTYENGLVCMIIEAYGDPTYMPQLRQTAQWLLETQGPKGTWGYGTETDKKQFEEKRELRTLQVAGGRPVDQPVGGEPLTRVSPWEKGADGDNSVTQYALLGLHAASRSGIVLPRETWTRALETQRGGQGKDGGWGYYSGSGGYGSMTCAGICAVALARHELGEAEPAVDESVERGLAWLVENFSITDHPKHPKSWHYYYLYSLERVGRILDTEFVGEHEWYPLGARYLIDNQLEDGTWISIPDSSEPLLGSGFALLFLTRATPNLVAQERSGPGTLKTAAVTPPGQKIYIILDCTGTMMDEVAGTGRARFEVAREALVKLVEELPKNSRLALRCFGHRKNAREEGANEDTELVIPMGVPNREQLVARLEALRARGKTPLSLTLQQAASDLKGQADKDKPVAVLLVTDGGEDNTRPKIPPLRAAEDLGNLEEGLRLYVIGFDVRRPEWVEQLVGLARHGKGTYMSAVSGEALLREMKTAVFGVPEEFTISDASGRPAGRGEFGESRTLPAGKYRFRTEFAGRVFEEEFWVNDGATTAITFDAAQIAKDVAAGRAPAQAEAGSAASADPAPPAPPAGATRFCTNCGAKLAANAKFCTSCGAKLAP